MTRLAVSLLALLAAGSPVLAAAPRIDIVIGLDAPRLERFAARELAGQLRQLFDARVEVSQKVPATSEHLILVGSPLSAILMGLAVVLLLIPLVRTLRSRGKRVGDAIDKETVATAID